MVCMVTFTRGNAILNVSFNANRLTNPHCSKAHFSNHRIPLEHKLNQTTTTRFSWIVWTAPESENRQTDTLERKIPFKFPSRVRHFRLPTPFFGWRTCMTATQQQQQHQSIPSALFLFMEIVSRWERTGSGKFVQFTKLRNKHSWQNWLV